MPFALRTRVGPGKHLLHDIADRFGRILNCVHSTQYSRLVCFSGYRVFRRDRSAYGGGVAVYIKDRIHSDLVDILTRFDNVEIIGVDLVFADIDCRIICLHRKTGFSAADVVYITIVLSVYMECVLQINWLSLLVIIIYPILTGHIIIISCS